MDYYIKMILFLILSIARNIFYKNNKLQSISIIKNADLTSDNQVDAISGATVTAKDISILT